MFFFFKLEISRCFKVMFKGFILLMVQKSGDHHLGYINPFSNNGISTTNLIFYISTTYNYYISTGSSSPDFEKKKRLNQICSPLQNPDTVDG